MSFHGISQINNKEYLINTQVNNAVQENYSAVSNYFEEAYATYPEIPKGILEAVSFTMTRFYHVDSTGEESCIGLPRVYGVMGLTLNGKNYFRNNLVKVSQLSGISISEIINSPKKNIMAYAAAYIAIKNQLNISSKNVADQVPILVELSELPLTNDIKNNFALNSHLYSVLTFLNDKYYSTLCSFPTYSTDLRSVFGENNYKILSSKRVIVTDKSVINTEGQSFINNNSSLSPKSSDYGPAIWNPAASCNYTVGRAGTVISAIVIHDIEGTYAGCISWFQNCSAVVSAHYVLRSSDGQITQMVSEADKAWHVGSENPYTIGYEHEGYSSQTGWYTTAMYTSSADLSRDICNSGYGISPLRTGFWPWLSTTYYNVSSIPGSCTKIKGHQHYPNQTHTDPGPNWDWNYYFKLINNNPTVTTLTASSGNFYDTGGTSSNYSDDERDIWVISPTGASSITIDFSTFDTEDTWDYMYIYDGSSVWAPLIGYYTGTNSPGTITSTGGALTIEFRSDCLTNAPGWEATWTSSVPAPADTIPPTTEINITGNWQTQDFTTDFTDADNVNGSGLEKSFYTVADLNGTWHGNNDNGFITDNFISLDTSWHTPAASGTWNISSNTLVQIDSTVGNSNIYTSLNQNLSNRYIYHFKAKLSSATDGANEHRFGIHFFCDSADYSNRNNSYFIYLRQEQHQLEFYKVVNNTFTLYKTNSNVVTNFDEWYDYKVIFDRITGKIAVYRNDVFLDSWTDSSPLTTSGNYFSFRTGNSKVYFDSLEVFRSRYPSVSVNVGAASTNSIRYQNPDPLTPSGLIKSICSDSAGNLSTIVSQYVNIDWTNPTCSNVNDGIAADEDTTTSSTTLSANWTSSTDSNSDISKYWYAIGTTLGGTDIVSWTDNGLNVSITNSTLTLVDGQEYYFSIKSVNGAGLESICYSDGIYADINMGLENSTSDITEVKIFPNPAKNSVSVSVNLKESKTIEILLIDQLGKRIVIQPKITQPKGVFNTTIDTKSLALNSGTYTLKIIGDKDIICKNLIILP